MLDEVLKIARWVGIISVIVLIIAIFVFWYFEMKKIEYLLIKIEEITSPTEEIIETPKEILLEPESSPQDLTEKEVPSSTLPETSQFERKEEISLSKTTIHLPILVYHHINYLLPNATKLWRDLTVSPKTFETQMEYLFEQNYQPITFEEFLNFLKTGEEIPERSLIIAFDDGWKNQYQYALPVLKKYNFRTTFFVTVNYIGGGTLMNWGELKELLENGMEIGSHSMTHPNLRNLSDSILKYEIQNSKIILEKNLGQKINVFAYPYGAFDAKIIKVVKDSNYLAGRTTIDGIDQNLENMYTLKVIQVYDNLNQFKRIFPLTE